MKTLYTLGIHLFGLVVRVLALFQRKPRLWVRGRKGWKQELESKIGNRKDWVWFHCASLGEFEQGRPLIEAIRQEHPDRAILLTFFSPSGYEVRKNYAGADVVFYLPLDTPGNVRYFLDIVRPRLVVFVKYDLWIHFLTEVQGRNIPSLLVAVILRPDSKFLRSALKGLYRRVLQGMERIYTQDENTAELLAAFSGKENVVVAGDTRFDRAMELPGSFQPIPEIEGFVQGRRCIVAGSPWEPDLELLLPTISRLREENLCWIIAPHEIHVDAIQRQVDASEGRMVRFSHLPAASRHADVLWIDNIGMLNRLYHYAEFAYIGGGFGSGIHNTQEAAVYGKPVVFGPKYQGFREAVDMVRAGGAVSVSDQAQLESCIRLWLEDPELCSQLGQQNAAYMAGMAGATGLIMEDIRQQRWLDGPAKV